MMWRGILSHLNSLRGTGLCWLCDLPAPLTSGLCDTCFADLPRLAPEPIAGVVSPGAARLHLAALWYQQPVVRWLAHYKFQHQAGLAKHLAPLLAAQVLALYQRQQLYLPQALIPVPLSYRRWLQRGYNQADLLARQLGNLLGLPVIQPVIRARHTRASHQLSASSRALNLSQAFRYVGGVEPFQRLALVDDILTSGATTAAVGNACQAAQPLLLDVWAMAYTPPKSATESG